MIPLPKAMKIDELKYFGIPSYIITIWKKHYSPVLLPVQERAVRQFGLLKSVYTAPSFAPDTFNPDTPGSLLVVSASSSGKTFIGEMPAIQEILSQKKVIFLVPLRVLVEEKYRHFLHLYHSIGLQVKKSSRDHRLDDKDIITGHFDIAVIVYEKFYSLLFQYPQFLQNVSLLIADEIELINDPQRGPRLENILSYLKTNHADIRIIGLCAFSENIQRLANSLDLPVLFSGYRPVVLRKGIVRHGSYHYIEEATGNTGTEVFFPEGEAQECNLASYLKATLDYLLKQDQTSLIFFPTRKKARLWSKWLAGEFPLAPAQSAIEELESMEESVCREELISLLKKAVSYHCAELCWQERHLIEQAARRGEIKIICATETLAMGVNLPVDNVILTGEKVICPSANGKTNPYSKRMLTVFEVENMGGRAGRLGKQNHFGRIIFLAPSPIELTAYQKHYFSFQEIPLLSDTPAFGPGIFTAGSTLNYLPTGPEAIPLKTEPDIFTFLLHKIALGPLSADELYQKMLPANQRKGKYFWSYRFEAQTDRKNLWIFLHQLEKEHLIRIHEGKICHIAPMGSLIASRGISYATYLHLKKWLDESREHPPDNLEILFLLASSFDGGQLHMPSYAGRWSKGEKDLREKQEKYFLNHVLSQIFQQGEEAHFSASHEMLVKKYPAIKKTLLIFDWIEGRELIHIEQEFGILHGGIENIAQGFSWLCQSLSAIAVKKGWKDLNPDALRKIRQLSGRIVTGVKPDGLALAQLHIPGLTRGYIHRLVEEGYDTKECLQELTEKQLSSLLPKRLIDKIKKYLSSEKDSDLAPGQKERPESLKVLKDQKPKDPFSGFTAQTRPGRVETKATIHINPDRPDQIFFLEESMKVNRMNFRLIGLLVKNQGKLISYEKIIDTLWPDDEDATYHRLWYHLAKLRGEMQRIIRRKNLPKDYLRQNILKVFPGRGLLLENAIKTIVKET